MSCPPILFLIFNRPDLTRRVFERIREARPEQLFIAADGPRGDREEEAAVCEETRRVALQQIDWKCDVRTLFRDFNLGCKAAVSSAITWFFENVAEGIILEDDCLPDPSFFPYCRELLSRYRYDSRIGIISGQGSLKSNQSSNASYDFTVFTLIWGWASWARSWRLYDGDYDLGCETLNIQWLQEYLGSKESAEYFGMVFRETKSGNWRTWDSHLEAVSWLNNMLNIVPRNNLVQNIGFDGRGTNYQTNLNEVEQASLSGCTTPCAFPLIHPTGIRRDFDFDRFLAFSVWKIVSSERHSVFTRQGLDHIYLRVHQLLQRFSAGRIALNLLRLARYTFSGIRRKRRIRRTQGSVDW